MAESQSRKQIIFLSQWVIFLTTLFMSSNLICFDLQRGRFLWKADEGTKEREAFKKIHLEVPKKDQTIITFLN